MCLNEEPLCVERAVRNRFLCGIINLVNYFLLLLPQEYTTRDVLDKLRAVRFSSANWRELGQRLTPMTDFDAIEDTFPRAQRRLEEVVSEWRSKGEVTWETLAEAVAQCDGGGPNVGRDLLEEVGIGTFCCNQQR